MKRAWIIGTAIAAVAAAAAVAVRSAAAEETVKVGWCAKTLTSATSPFAIANKLGWYARDGIKVELSPLPGSTDCVKLVATGDLPVSLPSIEPLAIIHPQGVDAKVFYTATRATSTASTCRKTTIQGDQAEGRCERSW